MFTFVATTHSLFWNKIRPVFVDIEPDFYTLDPEKVEAAITPWTTAILAWHGSFSDRSRAKAKIHEDWFRSEKLKKQLSVLRGLAVQKMELVQLVKDDPKVPPV